MDPKPISLEPIADAVAPTDLFLFSQDQGNGKFKTMNAPASLIMTPGVVSAITDFEPVQGPTGTSVIITGTGFTGATAVKFGGIPATSFTVNSATQITAVVPTGAQTGKISAITPGGTPVSTNNFTVLPSPPTITGFAPTSDSTEQTCVITGTNFAGTTIVSFGGTPAASFTIDSATQISAVVGSGTSGSVVVTTSAGTATLAGFTFVPGLPAITSFSPASGPIGTQVVITGNNFTNVISVSVGGISAAFTVNSITQITALIDSNSVTGLIRVTTAGGAANSVTNFTVSAGSAPTITSFIPTSAPQGTPVVITGTNLTGATIVTFGGTNAASYAVNSATQITAAVGSGTSGSIAVTTPVGSASHAGFTFTGGTYQAAFTTAAHNVGSAETDLFAYTVPGGTLVNNGDYLRFDANGTFANPARLRGYWAGEILFDTGAVGTTGQAWTVRMDFKYRHPIAAECQVTVTVNAVQIISQLVTVIGAHTNWAPTLAEGTQIPQVFKITGTGTLTSDVTALSGIISRFSVGTPATLLMEEQFVGSPGASLAGRAPSPTPPPTADTWHIGTLPVLGQYAIRANGTEATCTNDPADNSSCFIDVGVSNFDVSVDLDSLSDEKNGLAFRVQNAQSYMWFNSASSSNHAVGKEDFNNAVGGFLGQPAQPPVVSNSPTQSGVLHNFRVACYGPDVIFFCNGLRVFLGQEPRGVTNTRFLTETKIGLNQYGEENELIVGDPHFKNLKVYAVPTVTPGVAMRVVNDPLNDVNGTLLPAHVPDIPYWGAWIPADTGTGSPVWTINAGKLSLTSVPNGVGLAYLNSHYYDGIAQAIVNLSNNASRQGLAIRVAPAAPFNHWRVTIKTGLLEIVEIIGNSAIPRAQQVGTFNTGIDYLVVCAFKGPLLVATVGAVTCQWASATTNQLSTWHGLSAGSQNEATFRAFQMTNNPP